MRASLYASTVVVAPDDIEATSGCHRVTVGLTLDCRYTHFSDYVMHPGATQKVSVGLDDLPSDSSQHALYFLTHLGPSQVNPIRPLSSMPDLARTSMWDLRTGPTRLPWDLRVLSGGDALKYVLTSLTHVLSFTCW